MKKQYLSVSDLGRRGVDALSELGKCPQSLIPTRGVEH
jgi:hypothetical protein